MPESSDCSVRRVGFEPRDPWELRRLNSDDVLAALRDLLVEHGPPSSRSVIQSADEISSGRWRRLLASAEVILNTAHPCTQKRVSLLDYPLPRYGRR